MYLGVYLKLTNNIVNQLHHKFFFFKFLDERKPRKHVAGRPTLKEWAGRNS